MAKKEMTPLVLLPYGEMGAFFSANCFYNLNAINPQSARHDVKEPQDPVAWPGMELSYKANVIAGANRMS